MSAIEAGGKTGDLALSHGSSTAVHPSLPWLQRIEEHPSWPVLAEIPEKMIAAVVLPRFTLRDLMTMEKGSVFKSDCLTSDLIPMKIGTVQIAWGEFELVDHSLALRVTRLA